MSDYYTPPADVLAGVRARSTKINEIIQSVEDGFDELPSDLTDLKAEVIAARIGEDSLAIKNTSQDTLIAALGGDPVAILGLDQATLKSYFLL